MQMAVTYVRFQQQGEGILDQISGLDACDCVAESGPCGDGWVVAVIGVCAFGGYVCVWACRGVSWMRAMVVEVGEGEGGDQEGVEGRGRFEGGCVAGGGWGGAGEEAEEERVG